MRSDQIRALSIFLRGWEKGDGLLTDLLVVGFDAASERARDWQVFDICGGDEAVLLP